MPSGQKLYRYVDVDDKTPVQKLKLADQLRLLLRKLTEDPANELKSEDAVTAEYMRLQADCLDFIRKSTEPLRLGTKNTVYVQIANEFRPVLKEVLNSKEVKSYYDVLIAKPRVDYDIPLEYLLEIKRKGVTNEINNTE